MTAFRMTTDGHNNALIWQALHQPVAIWTDVWCGVIYGHKAIAE